MWIAFMLPVCTLLGQAGRWNKLVPARWSFWVFAWRSQEVGVHFHVRYSGPCARLAQLCCASTDQASNVWEWKRRLPWWVISASEPPCSLCHGAPWLVGQPRQKCMRLRHLEKQLALVLCSCLRFWNFKVSPPTLAVSVAIKGPCWTSCWICIWCVKCFLWKKTQDTECVCWCGCA